MTRRAFGGWGSSLDDHDFAKAVAALGVVAPLLSARGKPQPPSFRRYVRLLAHASRPQQWDLSVLGSDRARRLAALRKFSPKDLARAWWEARAYTERLEVRLSPWLDPASILQIVSEATVVHSARLHGEGSARYPYLSLPEPEGRPRWHWPLRVGFLADPFSQWVRSSFYFNQPDYVHALTQEDVAPTRCDLLVLPGDIESAIDTVARWSSVPEATAVLVIDKNRPAGDLRRAPELAAHFNAWAVAAVRVSGSWANWYMNFIRELSHARPLIDCIGDAGGVVATFAATRVAEAPPVAEASKAFISRMEKASAPVANAVALAMPPDTAAALASGAALGPALLTLAYDSERKGASIVASTTRAATPVLDRAEREQAPSRFIRVQVHDGSHRARPELHRGFRAGATHKIAVSVGPRDEQWLAAQRPFPSEKLGPDPAGHRLTVVLTEANLLEKPLLGTVELPPFGPSDTETFSLPVPVGTSKVDARITVLHRGRILQTAVLRGQVFAAKALARLELQDEGPAIQLLIEAVLRPGLSELDQRRRFQAAVVLNHDRDGRSLATLIGGGRAALFRLDWATDAVRQIRQTFEDSERDRSFGRKLQAKTSLDYLRRLALHGRTLYRRIGSELESKFGRGKLAHVQILSVNPNTSLPIEVIYDLPPPNHRPRLCPNWKQALAEGTCDPPTHHVEDVEGRLNVVCPAGFWGISKVVERQAVDPSRLTEDPETRGIDFAVLPAPSAERSTLGGLAPVLFAASEHINEVEPSELKRVSGALRKLTGGRIHQVTTWKDWAIKVKKEEPPVLLLLSHTELNTPVGAVLEIAEKGSRERRAAAEITKNYVNLNGGRPGPIVILLGCDTAVPQGDVQSFVVQFQEMGASVVVGTLAPVLGRHTGRAAEALLDAMRTMASAADVPPQGVNFGEALRSIRRKLLAQGILIALCLTAYGDADWMIPATR